MLLAYAQRSLIPPSEASGRPLGSDLAQSPRAFGVFDCASGRLIGSIEVNLARVLEPDQVNVSYVRPVITNWLYKDNRDGTFIDVTEGSAAERDMPRVPVIVRAQ